MRRCIRSVTEDRGFTIVEVMVASLMLVVGVFSTLALIDVANGATVRTKAREGGTNLARELTEAARNIPYNRLNAGSIRFELESQPGLNDSSPGGGWTIRRRGFTYKVTARVCTVDDTEDGKGALDSQKACPGYVPGSTGDEDPDDYKRVEVSLTWSPPQPENTVTQTTIINNPGAATGPSIDALAMTQPPGSSAPYLITSGGVTQAVFQVTTSNLSARVPWSVDGGVQGDASGSGTSWSFTWNIANVYDGTYEIGAQAYLDSGAFGPLRSATVKLDRARPIAPTAFAGGRNGNVVEFEWQPNPEGDVVGYRVYRLANGSRAGGPVCETTSKTACVDASPPPDDELRYEVVALEEEPAGPEEGAPSTTTVRTGNNPPNAPSGLTAEREGDVTTLTWTAASPPDPDAGDELLFYRIYRDGTTYEDRYDITGDGLETTFEDTRTDGATHTYWVTAVDSQLAESVLLGPVEL